MKHNLEPVLEQKHKIFLSHSGKQKDLVEFLCEALESRCHTPFFDKRPSSLPKGKTFANLIFQAVEQCEMMVVVISDDYFMSKWPMMELQAFVQAIEGMKNMPGNTREKYILPLFYELSVEEFRDKERRRKWVEMWMVAKEGGKRRRVDVNAWEKAVDVLGNYNGIVYKSSLGIRSYLDEIVSHICDIVIGDVKWDDSHVQGKSNICKVLLEKVKSVECMEKYKCKTVGIFGVGGIGKTTICKALCNELSNEYEGRVCHIELETQARASSSSLVQSQARASVVVESLRKLVILLTKKNSEFVQKLDEGECKYILRSSNMSQRSFIALDNIWDASVLEAKTILETPNFHEKSLVIVTARSQFTLEKLGICGDACLEMPELGEEDAVKLFLYHVAHGKQFGSEEERHDILQCIERCYFDKGGGNGWHYHSLALRSLGAQVSCMGERPSEWVRNLPRSFKFVGGGGNPVFDILRSSFDMLEYNEQSLFMDLVMYRPFIDVEGCDFEHADVGSSYNDWDSVEGFEFEQSGHGSCWADMVEWLCLVHEVNEDEIKSKLDSLKRKGLLLDVDWTTGRISVHDLYVELAELESEQMLDCENWRWVSGLRFSELKKRPSGGCWQKLSRVGIVAGIDQITNLERINWQFFSNLVVLELVGDNKRLVVQGSLNLKGLECLRSVAVIDVNGLERIEGLDGLDDLAFFKWEYLRWEPDSKVLHSKSSIGGHLPASLEVLDLNRVWLERDVLVECNKLHKLTLITCGAMDLDLNGCSSLEFMSLKGVEKLRSLLLPRNSRGACGLKSLLVKECWDLVEIPGLDEHIGLERLALMHCRRFKWKSSENVMPFSELQLPDMENFTKLKDLRMRVDNVKVGALCNLQQLRKLFYSNGVANKAPSLRGCDQLEVLHLKLHPDSGGDEEETNLEGLEDLPALRTLSLNCCRVLAGLPDLSRSRKLEVIMFDEYSYIELQEDDMHMLASLPVLQRVGVVSTNLELDVRRRKWIDTTHSEEWDFHIFLPDIVFPGLT